MNWENFDTEEVKSLRPILFHSMIKVNHLQLYLHLCVDLHKQLGSCWDDALTHNNSTTSWSKLFASHMMVQILLYVVLLHDWSKGSRWCLLNYNVISLSVLLGWNTGNILG